MKRIYSFLRHFEGQKIKKASATDGEATIEQREITLIIGLRGIVYNETVNILSSV